MLVGILKKMMMMATNNRAHGTINTHVFLHIGNEHSSHYTVFSLQHKYFLTAKQQKTTETSQNKSTYISDIDEACRLGTL